MKTHCKQRSKEMEWTLILGIVAVWFVLNRWILPRFGIQT
jgi:hypothetical protein